MQVMTCLPAKYLNTTVQLLCRNSPCKLGDAAKIATVHCTPCPVPELVDSQRAHAQQLREAQAASHSCEDTPLLHSNGKRTVRPELRKT